MEASQKTPVYTVYIISGTTKYNVTPAIVSLGRDDTEGQIAQRVTMELMNVQIDDEWLSSILQAVDRVFIYANDGTKNEEVFRGFLWEGNYKYTISDRSLRVKAYDHLIYLQESEDSMYFSGRKTTEDIISHICKKWGIKLEYSYNSITNGKLPLRGNLYDILTTDILDLTQRHTGDKYVILSEKDVMKVRLWGANSTVYHFVEKENVSGVSSKWTMDGVTTQILILGKSDDNGHDPVELEVPSNREKYGTLQKIQQRDEETELWEARVEAEVTLKEVSSPFWTFEVKAPDIPWIRKGDRVRVDAGDIKNSHLYVTAVSRNYEIKTASMTLQLSNKNTVFATQTSG